MSHHQHTNIVSLALTGEDDHGGAQQQVDRGLPPGRHPGQGRGDEDLGRDVELQRKGNEDAEAVEQLDDLVGPGGGRDQKGGGGGGSDCSSGDATFLLLCLISLRGNINF